MSSICDYSSCPVVMIAVVPVVVETEDHLGHQPQTLVSVVSLQEVSSGFFSLHSTDGFHICFKTRSNCVTKQYKMRLLFNLICKQFHAYSLLDNNNPV